MQCAIRIWSCFILAVLLSCSGSSPAPATVEGKWTYTTTDGKLRVDFELVKNSSGSVDIKNPASIKVNGTTGAAAAQMTGVSLPNITSIVINANDAALPCPHSITFNNCKFVSDSNRIDVTSGSYTVYSGCASPTTTNFSTVTIIRP